MRYEIRYGKFGVYFYDIGLRRAMTPEEVLKKIEDTKQCDICGENTTQVYCIKCLDNSVHNDYRIIARNIEEKKGGLKSDRNY